VGFSKGKEADENKEADVGIGLLDEKGYFLDSRWSLS